MRCSEDVLTICLKGGELFERLIQLGHISEKDAAVIIKQVIEGIAYLHSKGIVHR